MRRLIIIVVAALIVVVARSTDVIYFVHMRKCGGSTIGAYVRLWLKERGCCSPPEECKLAPFFMSSLALDTRKWQCHDLHFVENEYHCLGAAPSFASTTLNYIFITSLRHPIDRIVSTFWYHGGPGNLLLREAAFRTCCTPAGAPTGKVTSTQIAQMCLRAQTHVKQPRMLEGVTRLAGEWCYEEALRDARHNQSQDLWRDWTQERHLARFRSLHSEYVSNYFVRRLVGSCEASDMTLKCPCNVRRTLSLTFPDLVSAKELLQTFDAVLIMEWLWLPGISRDRLRRALGPPFMNVSLVHARKGILSDVQKDQNSLIQELRSEGRSESWRESQVPKPVLLDLVTRNSLDLDLYYWATKQLREGQLGAHVGVSADTAGLRSGLSSSLVTSLT